MIDRGKEVLSSGSLPLIYSRRLFSNPIRHSDPERSEGEESRPFASAQGDKINNLEIVIVVSWEGK